ncbi:Methyltransferase domain-containing protein [Sulfobacillus thermosulfidooxidans DSM 9293]|uniref:Methyltransferase domain-containing protein n=1 Tax=Sulfobacillus thermosulfidooxidans (strain DSM 9293 / VKM B-1269 / AT-1) TaxID=929705 RepID=A0A1W1WGN3_SULTA|nr:class I SAM-dependent methyltransferase [Sulfobacillus thermosulfidooxidans]SMC05339.1 Methyltransferase domain-containing protein [Sulfobacillus thermosulfidooxidans DSM 9293]
MPDTEPDDALPRARVDHPWFSRGYPLAEWALELALGDARRAQNAQASGRTLIIGAGTGLDVPVLGRGATDVVLLEPDATMRRTLFRRFPEWAIVGASAEAMPFTEGTFDTVISSLVLCSVGDVARVLEEITRVLVPGGQYLFLEHIANPHRLAGMVQQGIEPVWRLLGGGCRLIRDVETAVRQSPLTLTYCETVRAGGLLPIIRGRAMKSR